MFDAAARRAAEADPLSPAALRGERLFFGNGAWCSACHNGVNFTDEQFHIIGIGLTATDPDLGRLRVTGRGEDWGAFKTPTIRNAVHTAPYMHDGSLATLEEVVQFYREGARPNSNLSPHLAPIEMSDLEAANLLAFLRALTPRAE